MGFRIPRLIVIHRLTGLAKLICNFSYLRVLSNILPQWLGGNFKSSIWEVELAKKSKPRPQKGAAHEHATHVVLFRRRSERNTVALSGKLQLERRTTAADRRGVQSFARTGDRVGVRVFEKLGLATLTSDEATADSLRALDEVEDVFVNEERHVPRPVSAADVAVQRQVDVPGIDYLEGLRDGISAAISAMTGREAPALPVQPREIAPAGFDTESMTWGLSAIGIDDAYPWTGRGVRVAVLDTGIDLDHPDFQGRVSVGETAKSFVSGETVQDVDGHGSHCCGTVGGPRAPISGLRYGVAPEVDLIAGKVLDNSGSGWDDDIVDGITWAADEAGARIISLSLGSFRDPQSPYSRLYERVAERLLEDEERGVLLVAAAGNDSRRAAGYVAAVNNPAACPSIMTVGAVDTRRVVADFSNGDRDGIGRIDLVAPGVGVRSAAPGGGMAALSGTSMATPHVAGVAALYMQAYPAMSATEVWDRMLADAQNLGTPIDYGAGMVRVPNRQPTA